MSYDILEGLKPAEFFRWFGRISEIPRGSGHENKMIAFLQDFAKNRGLYCDTDDAGNIHMFVPASKGYETQPSILFQAHMDMVWAQENGMNFDFENQPIRLKVNGDKLCAEGTTLGADNGVGLATMLAIADAEEMEHPLLEFLFTVEEEVGLKGIRKFDMKKIRSRRMINMDCGDSHVLCVSSAGKIGGRIEKQYNEIPVPKDYTCIEIELKGGLGGHSGLAIHKGRACAVNNTGDLLLSIQEIPYLLAEVETSTKAIFKECRAVIAIPAVKESEVRIHLQETFQSIRSIYAYTDPDLQLYIRPFEAGCALAETDSKKIAAMMSLIRTSPYRADGVNPEVMITSNSVHKLTLQKGQFLMEVNIRASSDADAELLFHRFVYLGSLHDMDMQKIDQYSGWAEKPDSPFREKFDRIHRSIYGTGLGMERVHGGIEVGMITGAIPDMDAVGIAPTSRGAHTPEEYLLISQVEPYWTLLKAVLAEKE